MVLEPLTLPPGAVLPSTPASELEWLRVAGGVLDLSLEGEQLPFRWKSGAERTFRVGQRLPAIADGTRMTLRNADDVPLLLWRLTIMPTETGTSAATASPERGTQAAGVRDSPLSP